MTVENLCNAVRVGIFRDRPVFETCRSLYTSVVVPAHIAAYAGDGLWGFLTGIASAGTLDFWYDPMTYYVELPTEYWFRGSEEHAGPRGSLPAVNADLIRPAFRELLRAYGLLDIAVTGAADDVIQKLVSEGVSEVLGFQRRGVGPKSQKAVSKYAQILGLALGETSLQPSRIVAPYLAITSRDEAGERRQATLNGAALGAKLEGEDLWTVLAIESNVGLGPLQTGELARLRLSEFSGVGVWVSGLDEYSALAAQLRSYRAMVSSIPAPVWLLYGGYYGILMAFDGVQTVSHGVYYTENKRIRSSVGSGPPAERYYIPRLHRFYEPARALRTIEAVPGLQCECPECPSLDLLRAELTLAPTAPERRMAWIARLQRHFLYARAREIDSVRTSVLAEALTEMSEAAQEVRQAMPEDPEEADWLVSHLDRWASSYK